jgi:hypothetical protein
VPASLAVAAVQVQSPAKSVTQKREPAPVRDLGDRFINRAALGYEPTDETDGPRTR